MVDALISGAISGILVILEFFGILIAKNALIRKPAERAALQAMADFYRNFKPEDVPTGQNINDYLIKNLETIGDFARSKAKIQVFSGMIPGPELCFFSLTIQATVFLIYNYASSADRLLLCPLLAGSNNAFPIFLGIIFINLALWWFSYFWREAIITNWQTKARKLSMFIIAFIGCLNMSGCVYLLIALR